MNRVFGLTGALVGGLILVGIWIPRFRANWKGTNVRTGALSCFGMGLLFVTIGMCMAVLDDVPERNRVWFVLPLPFAMIAILIGYDLDMARAKGELLYGRRLPFVFAVVAVCLTVAVLLISILMR